VGQFRTQKTQSWDQVLNMLVSEKDFQDQIQKKGFFASDQSFKGFTKKYNFTSERNTASYLSLDFWSYQPNILKEKNLYILRTGGGNFIILDNSQFTKPYLDLNTSKYSKLTPQYDEKFSDLLDSFNTRQENAGLEQLNILGVYDSLVKELLGSEKWHIGPRGNKRSKFRVYANKKENDVQLIYNFDGQEELDYTIWTKDHILLFEAKSLTHNKGLDVGWHKMAYPASRFRKYEKYKIIPIYFLKWNNVIHLFVFPEFKFHGDGILLNDQNLQMPASVFRVDLVTTISDF
jgi:hypothetical protein